MHDVPICPFSKASDPNRKPECDVNCRLYDNGNCLIAEYLKRAIKNFDKQDK